MKIEDHNDLNVVFFAFRYALGRSTAAPSIVINKIKEVWDDFPLHDKEQMLEEITRELDRTLLKTVPMNECEISDEWYKFKSWISNKIREEKIDEVIKGKS